MSNVEYHRVLAGERRRVGRGILAIVLLLGGLLVFSVVLSVVAVVLDDRGSDGDYTPLTHAAAMLSLALLLPWSMVIQRWLYGVPGASLHSVFSRFRFALFGRALLFILPVCVAALVVSDHLAPEPRNVWSETDVLWMLAATLLLTPWQAAGEEYGFRGLLFRIVGSWTRGSRAGLVLGLIVMAVIFAASHAASDAWLNLWYVVLAVGTGLITWRTGGLEVAIVLHALWNTLGFVFSTAMRSDLNSVVTDRDAGTATAATLIPSALVLATVVVVWFTTRRTGPLTAETGSRPA
uniref:CPBP family intramembrane glutamic endopeptidase n=1 Tax=Paractinoplanes polyasparticus TaxID=2856853 RepID=UPI001C85EA44|nr:CPBP family intramembrane glutamic endopeptidase [Actinoplanes polyasparticus]